MKKIRLFLRGMMGNLGRDKAGYLEIVRRTRYFSWIETASQLLPNWLWCSAEIGIFFN